MTPAATRVSAGRGTAAAALAVLLALGITPLLRAHPAASSFVIVTVSPERVATIDITTDAASLLLKFESSRAPDPAGLSPAATAARVKALMPVLLRHVALATDLGPLELSLAEVAPAVDSAGRLRVTLMATVPAAARTLRWRSSLFLGSYPVCVRGGDARAATDVDGYEWLVKDEWTASHPVSDLARRSGWWPRIGSAVALGFTHILPGGLDHVLFVVGLFLLAAGTRSLLLQISAFTVAHSVTLASAALGVVSVPAALVEPLIALSIAYVAIENLVRSSLSRWRLAMVFGFGLLHGLGFAGALRDLGVGDADLPATLVGFNIGVELGQIAVVLLAAIVIRLMPIPAARRQQWVAAPASVVIAVMGIVWAVQRITTH